MNSKKQGYIDVDTLIAQTPLETVLGHYGLPTPLPGSNEYRMNCVFNDGCAEANYGNLAVKPDTAKRIYCHSCQTKGNLLTLLYGLENRKPPSGGRLRGKEFKQAVEILKQLNGLADVAREQVHTTVTAKVPASSETSLQGSPPSMPTFNVNVPLHRHDKEPARQLANLHSDFVADVGAMSPEAATYCKRRPWLTSEVMEKWKVGWIPGNGRSMFRKHYFVYTHHNVRGDVVSYSGRHLLFEEKQKVWLRKGKPDGSKPMKHKYVAGFRRGAELYGGSISRLEQPHIQESLNQHGLVVVEGMNDVIRLDEMGVCAVGICSNKATDQQVEMLDRFSKQVADHRLLLLPDCDEKGEEGFKELLWRLGSMGASIRLGMTSEMHGGRFQNKQPEDLMPDDWAFIYSRTY